VDFTTTPNPSVWQNLKSVRLRSVIIRVIIFGENCISSGGIQKDAGAGEIRLSFLGYLAVIV